MITFNTTSAFHEFVHYAVEKGLSYKATEVGGEYVVYVTGY